jgi:DNA-directed RNA polymerase sigma subunit (sigma70/sigma32)
MVSDNEREVLNRLFVYADESVTLRSVGADMNVSHERVRQIRNAALNRIRKSSQYENMVAEAKYLRKEAV